jgi:hypothetical protein
VHGLRHLDEAVTVAIVQQLFDIEDPEVVLNLVRAERLKFAVLCNTLLQHQKTMVLVLDDVPDMASDKYDHFLKEVMKDTTTQAQKMKAVMSLLRDMLERVLGKPGMIVYLTGRSLISLSQPHAYRLSLPRLF